MTAILEQGVLLKTSKTVIGIACNAIILTFLKQFFLMP